MLSMTGGLDRRAFFPQHHYILVKCVQLVDLTSYGVVAAAIIIIIIIIIII
jgi:hypothetical protein